MIRSCLRILIVGTVFLSVVSDSAYSMHVDDRSNNALLWQLDNSLQDMCIKCKFILELNSNARPGEDVKILMQSARNYQDQGGACYEALMLMNTVYSNLAGSLVDAVRLSLQWKVEQLRLQIAMLMSEFDSTASVRLCSMFLSSDNAPIVLNYEYKFQRYEWSKSIQTSLPCLFDNDCTLVIELVKQLGRELGKHNTPFKQPYETFLGQLRVCAGQVP